MALDLQSDANPDHLIKETMARIRRGLGPPAALARGRSRRGLVFGLPTCGRVPTGSRSVATRPTTGKLYVNSRRMTTIAKSTRSPSIFPSNCSPGKMMGWWSLWEAGCHGGARRPCPLYNDAIMILGPPGAKLSAPTTSDIISHSTRSTKHHGGFTDPNRLLPPSMR